MIIPSHWEKAQLCCKVLNGVNKKEKLISNVIVTAGSAVESVENFLNDCACETSLWGWRLFDHLLHRARGYRGEGGKK